MPTCKDCSKFIGLGDWNLCCKEKHEGYPFGFLCYEDTEACEKFVPKTTELCTFPDDDKDYCKCFTVPTDWLIDVLERIDSFNNQEGVDLERFLDNYVWEETWFIYLQAKTDNKLIMEEEQE